MPFNGGGFSNLGFGKAGVPAVAGPVANANGVNASGVNGAAAGGGGLGGVPVWDQLVQAGHAVVDAISGKPDPNDPWAGAPPASTSQQAAGVVPYGGGFWTSKGCPPCAENIRALQRSLNNATAAAGTPARLTVDALVGSGTVRAMGIVADAAKQHGWIAESNYLAGFNSQELIAKNADVLIARVDAVAARLQGINQATAPQQMPVVPDGAPQPSPGGALAPYAPVPTWRRHLPLIVGGGILAAGIATAVIIMRAPRRGAAAAE